MMKITYPEDKVEDKEQVFDTLKSSTCSHDYKVSVVSRENTRYWAPETCFFPTLKQGEWTKKKKNSSGPHPPTWSLSEGKEGGAKPFQIYRVTGEVEEEHI